MYNYHMSRVDGLQAKACSLLKFLYALEKSRYRTYTNYESGRQHVLWFADLINLSEKYSNIDLVFIDTDPAEDAATSSERQIGAVVRIRKPPLEPLPEIPPQLASLIGYEKVGTQSLLKLKVQRLKKGPPFFSPLQTREANRALLKHLKDFFEGPWEVWQKDTEKAFNLYEELYRLRNELEKGGNVELVLAVGLLQHKPDHGPMIERHVLTLPCEIELDAAKGDLSVVPKEEMQHHQLELDFIEQENRPDEDNLDLRQVLEELGVDSHDRTKVTKVLRVLGHLMHGRTALKVDGLRPPKFQEGVYVWSYAPALVLRQRRPKAYLQLVKQAYEHCVEGGDALRTDALNYFLAEGQSSDGVDGLPEGSLHAGTSDEIYFPLPTNKEQLAIIEKVAQQPVVVVKGPPGTGKSHTIANLISHTLATGGRVLVTAEKAAALRVVLDKLPKGLRSLCITSLGSSKKDRELLESGLNTLLNAKETWREEDKRKEIDRLQKQREILRQELKVLEHDLLVAREAEVKEHRLAGDYGGKAADIVRQVNSRQKEFQWFKDVLAEAPPFPLTWDEVRFLVNYHESVDRDDVHVLTMWLPDELPDEASIRSYFQEDGPRVDSAEPRAHLYEGVPSETLESSREALVQYKYALQQLAALAEPSFVNRYTTDVLNDHRAEYWQEHTRKLQNAAKTLNELVKQLREHEVEFNTDPLAIKDAVARRIAFMKSGKPHRVLFRRAKELVDTDHVLKKVRVDEQPPETISALKVVQCRIRMVELGKRIDELLPPISAVPNDPSLANAERLDRVRSFLALRKELSSLRTKLSWMGEEAVGSMVDPAGVARLIDELTAAIERSRKQALEEAIDELLTSLKTAKTRGQAHPCVDRLCTALETKNLSMWREAYQEYLTAQEARQRHQRFEELVRKLASSAPRTADEILSSLGSISLGSRLRKLELAWHWASAKGWIEKYLGENRVVSLQDKRRHLHNKYLKVTEELASLKAYQAFFARFDHQAQSALRAWAQAMRRLGKGKGKFAEKHRASARKYMRQVKDELPAWILPLDRLWDTVTVDSSPFDLVIVDEASQAGIDSLLLLGLSKRIVVVGDDKQNTPQMIGIEESRVESLIKRHLEPFRFSDEFRPDSSLYDLSYLISSGNITLVEHYRCVPDIIRFNNREFYDGELIPLRQPPPNALEPLKYVFLPDAVSEGKNQYLSNRKEAQAIIDKIVELVRDPRYEGKSFGVVVLQGSAQIRLLERMLTNTLEPEVLEERRIRVGASSDFQGDERDVIFLSMVVDNHQRIRAQTSINDERRYNVAVSRARDQLWLFTSRNPNRLNSEDLRYRLIDHVRNPGYEEARQVEADLASLRRALQNIANAPTPPEPFDSWFEVKVAVELLRRGYRVLPQYRAGAYRIDLVVEGLRNRLAVECDGDQWHGPENYQKDMERQFQLERAGWTFVRILESEFYNSPSRAVQRVVEMCNRLNIEPFRARAPVSPQPLSGSPTSRPE